MEGAPFCEFPCFAEAAQCLFSFEIRQKPQPFSFFSQPTKVELSLFFALFLGYFLVANEFFFTFFLFFVILGLTLCGEEATKEIVYVTKVRTIDHFLCWNL